MNLWTRGNVSSCVAIISPFDNWLAGSTVVVHFIVFKHCHALLDCMVENILRKRNITIHVRLTTYMVVQWRHTLICSLSSWLVWLSLRCLNSSVWRKHDSRFSGDTKSSATLMQLWMLRTWIISFSRHPRPQTSLTQKSTLKHVVSYKCCMLPSRLKLWPSANLS